MLLLLGIHQIDIAAALQLFARPDAAVAAANHHHARFAPRHCCWTLGGHASGRWCRAANVGWRKNRNDTPKGFAADF